MKLLLAITMLIGAASLTAARAEWEILDAGTAVNATPAAPSTSSTTVDRSELAEVATK
jgi:hypothetical protein